jgi:hypothetical protein
MKIINSSEPVVVHNSICLSEDYREYYRERKKDNENRIKLTKSVVDMSHVQPKVTGQSMSYSQQYMFVRPPSPPPPPTLQPCAFPMSVWQQTSVYIYGIQTLVLTAQKMGQILVDLHHCLNLHQSDMTGL